MKVTKKNIWLFAQNKPTLVVRDIVGKYPKIPPEFIYDVLLVRGVFKWLAVRRDLIKLKDKWKVVIRELNRKKTPYEKGYHAAMIECRKEIRALCHSERFRAPDFDRHSIKFLKNKEKENV